jgi:hypothetical protein
MWNHEQVVRRVRLRLAALLGLKHAIQWLAAWAFLWGTIVLVLRAQTETPLHILLWGIAAIPACVTIALLRGWQRLPSLTAVRALLDKQNGCGGLLMAGAEVDLGRWDESMPAVRPPQLRWQRRRSVGSFLAGIGFVIFSFMVPERFVHLDAATPLEIGRDVDKLAGQIDVLKEERIVDAERANALKQKLEQLRDKASGKDPVKTLEALDHLTDLTNKTARSAAESSLSKTEQMGKTEALAEAIQKAGNGLDPKVQREAVKDLAAMMQQAAAESELVQKGLTEALNDLAAAVEKAAKDAEAMTKDLDPEALKSLQEKGLAPEQLAKLAKDLRDGKLDPAALKMCPGGSLAPEQLERIAKALRSGKQEIADRLEKLNKAGLLDLETLEQCANCGQCDAEALSRALNECKDGRCVMDVVAECRTSIPGQGGQTKDLPSKTPLIFGRESSAEGAKFKEEVLPPTSLESLKESRLAGVSRGQPKTNNAGPSKSGALQGAAAGDGSANTQIILPQHRRVVERFFERSAAGGK